MVLKYGIKYDPNELSYALGRITQSWDNVSKSGNLISFQRTFAHECTPVLIQATNNRSNNMYGVPIAKAYVAMGINQNLTHHTVYDNGNILIHSPFYKHDEMLGGDYQKGLISLTLPNLIIKSFIAFEAYPNAVISQEFVEYKVNNGNWNC